MRLCALVAAVILLLSAMTCNVMASSKVKSIRLWRAPDNTRLVFDLSAPAQHTVFTLTAPDRLVIDISGVTLAEPLKVVTANTPITALRSYQRTPTDLRVVIDLKKVVTPKSFSLPPNAQYGHRLVVDLYDNASPPILPRVSNVSAVPSNMSQPQIRLPRAQRERSDKRDIIVVIDPGHGGEDPGASGSRGQHEKDVVLLIARELQRQINSMKGYRAEMTRTGDYFIPLRVRTEIARNRGADLFASIHADAAPSAAAFGTSVFALSDSGATSETSRWLADRANRSDLIGGVGNVSLDDKDKMLASVLLDLSMTATLTSSLNVGQKVLSNIGLVTSLHKQRVEQAGFMVLKSPDIPSILIETGFISNTKEAAKLVSPRYHKALARAISTGIRQFFEQNPPPGSYIAWLRESGKIAYSQREHLLQLYETIAMLDARTKVSA